MPEVSTEKDPGHDREAVEREAPKDFIREIIVDDLRSNKHGGRVVTRFPPEPNGYLHIGHAKSICLNFGVAQEFSGTCHLRFDDTNPTTEDSEYAEAIQRDVRWLGFEWHDKLFYASDYFEQLYQHALQLIDDGKAYVCSLSEEEIREYRGTVAEPGRNSPYRERSVDENRDLFTRMRAGEFAAGTHVLRAKIDMAATNMKMRDPLLYRIRKAHHYRTGDAWPIYPMYDFAHCLSDSIEAITHSLCTLEFENNRELYDWVLDNTVVEYHPQQIEFARLNLSYTVMSKRKLLLIVEEGHVAGWDDPRMPTLSGLRRRGYTPEAIRNFCERIGIARTFNIIDVALLEHSLRDDLNHRAPRVLGVVQPLEVVIENYPEGQVEELEAPFFPRDVPRDESRQLPFSRRLFIERDDFMEDPPPGYFRLAPGSEVRLRYAYIIRCVGVVKNDAGEVVQLRCTYDPETRGGHAPDKRPVKGTIHWVSAEHAVPFEARLYDRLFVAEQPDAEQDFRQALNPQSLTIANGAMIEPSVAGAKPGDLFQLERQGYFCVDVDSQGGALILNRTVTLRDTWAKIQGGGEAEERDRSAAQKAADKAAHKARQRRLAKAAPQAEDEPLSPERQVVFERYRDVLGLSANEARLLAADEALSRLFEDAVAAHNEPQEIAKWIVNELLRELKDRSVDALPFGGRELGELVALISAKTISGPIAKQVLTAMLDGEGRPAEIVDKRGLRQVRDSAALEPIVEAVLAEHADKVAQYREGKTALFGFFVGQVMRASRGKANPQQVNALLEKKLNG